MRRSLRWRIQAWHALILGLVVAGAAAVFYVQVRRSRFDEIDAELLAGARVLEGVLRTAPEGQPDQEAGDLPESPAPGRRSPPRPPRPRDRRFQQALSLPPSFEERYIEEGQDPYFVIWRSDGEILRAEPPEMSDEVRPDPWIGPERHENARSRGRLREVSLLGPGETIILVGRPIGRELHELLGLAWRLSLSGLCVFAAGLLGGWWLAGRAVRPIATMSQTVNGITASSLSRRIDLEGVDTELGELGGLINTMLGRLEASFDQQVRFTADASHELRTPLTVVRTQVELALSRPRSAGEYREALEACDRAARRMTGLVEDLLTLARADAGKLALRWEHVELGPIVAECAELLGPMAESRDVRLVVNAAGASLKGDAAAACPGRDQLAEQRHRLQPAGWPGNTLGCGGRRHGRLDRRRYRRRHHRGGATAGVRPVLPGRQGPLARVGRQRPGAGNLQEHRRRPRRHDLRRQPLRQWNQGRGAAPADRPTP